MSIPWARKRPASIVVPCAVVVALVLSLSAANTNTVVDDAHADSSDLPQALVALAPSGLLGTTGPGTIVLSN